MATATKSRSKKLTLDEYKSLLEGERKEIKIDLPTSTFVGKLDTINKRIKKLVDESEIEGEWKISKKETSVYNGYYYRSPGGERHTKYAKYTITGYRDYTDAEIEVLGSKLLAEKLKREEREKKQRVANIKKYNAIAEKLGIEPLQEDSL